MTLYAQPAIFLDRDGVLIENRANYVRSWADVEIYPQAIKALVAMRHSPYKFIMVTNQSVVGRGLITLVEAQAINQRLLDEIERENGRLDAVYMCPHAPEDHCLCRKPQPGLLLQAAAELHLDLSRSIMIGDAVSDLQAGQSAGCAEVILLGTGRGQAQSRLPGIQAFPNLRIFATLADAFAELRNGRYPP